MLPTLVDQSPDGDEWIHEVKYDGYRTILAVDRDRTRAYTRTGQNWSHEYRLIIEEARKLPCKTAIIDGEMIVQNAAGVSDYAALRRAIKREPHRLILYAFDLIMLNGRDLRPVPLRERRARLEKLIGADPAGRIHFSPHLTNNGPEVFKAADRLGLEGIVSKRPDSLYLPGKKVWSWLKAKTFTTGDYEIIGVERSSTGIPVALLASGDKYVGNAMVSLGGKKREEFWKRIDALGTPHARLAHLHKRKGAQWIGPGLTATVRHLRGEEKLRHATLLTTRDDGN